MSDTVLNYAQHMNAVETLTTTEMPGAANIDERRRSFSGLNRQGQLKSDSTPKLEKPPAYQKITISGTTTIDLTAVPAARDPTNVTVDMTDKKLIGLQIEAAAANSGNVTVAPGSSNPYPLFGSGNSIIVVPGELITKTIKGAASGHPAVSGTVKTIDVTGTSSDVVEIGLFFGGT